MPRYSVTGAVHASTFIGEYDANTPEEAIELAYADAGVSLCHECARDVSDPEVCELTAEDVETGDATSEATTNDQVVEQAAEIERLRAEAKRADEEATALANSDLATTEQIVRALRVENDALRAKVRTITEHYKPGWVDGLHAVARSAGYDPDKLRHEGVDPPTFIEDVILGLRADLAKAQEKAAIYEKDWREAKSEFGTATSKLREQLRASEESATRGWEVADSFHITVSGLGAENERLRAALDDVMGACDAECAGCGAYYVAKRALDGEKEKP